MGIMATAKHSNDTLLEAADAVRRCSGNVRAAATSCGVNYSTFESRVRNAIDRGMISRAEMAALRRTPSQPASRLPQTADECWALLEAAIGRTHAQPPPPTFRQPTEKRIVIASDFHAPFQDVDAVAEMLRRTEGYDQIIVNGDLQDAYSVSRFTKHEAVPWERELAAVDALLSAMCRQYSDVLIVDGNHDRPRFEKALRTMLPLEMVHVVEYLTGGEFSSIRALAKRKGYQNIRFAECRVGRYHLGWFAQEGDLLVAHAEKFSRVPGAALRAIEEWFSDRHDTLGLAPWRVLVQAHTHQIGAFPWHADKMLVEGGCMCQTHGYQLDPKLSGRPQRVGFVTLTQRHGVTDIDSIKMHWLDPARKT